MKYRVIKYIDNDHFIGQNKCSKYWFGHYQSIYPLYVGYEFYTEDLIFRYMSLSTINQNNGRFKYLGKSTKFAIFYDTKTKKTVAVTYHYDIILNYGENYDLELVPSYKSVEMMPFDPKLCRFKKVTLIEYNNENHFVGQMDGKKIHISTYNSIDKYYIGKSVYLNVIPKVFSLTILTISSFNIQSQKIKIKHNFNINGNTIKSLYLTKLNKCNEGGVLMWNYDRIANSYGKEIDSSLLKIYYANLLNQLDTGIYKLEAILRNKTSQDLDLFIFSSKSKGPFCLALKDSLFNIDEIKLLIGKNFEISDLLPLKVCKEIKYSVNGPYKYIARDNEFHIFNDKQGKKYVVLLRNPEIPADSSISKTFNFDLLDVYISYK